jgi:hypothetical protein
MSKRRMNGDDLSHPFFVWSGVLEQKHIKKIGQAIWLFLWLINATTEERRMDDGEYQGWVYGGKPLKFAELAKFLSTSERSIQRHVRTLFDGEYIDLLLTPYGYQFRVHNSCRWPEAQAKSWSTIKAKDGASVAKTAKMARQVRQKWQGRSAENGVPGKNSTPKVAYVSQDKPVDSWIKQLDEPGDKPAAHGAACVLSLKENSSREKPEEKTFPISETQEQKIQRQISEVRKQSDRARVYSPPASKEFADAFIQSIIGPAAKESARDAS